MANFGNPLSAGSLAVFIAASIPKASNPQIKNAYEAVALAVHAGMLSVGFKLKGLGEDHNIGKFSLPADHTPGVAANATVPLAAESDAQHPQELPSEWNASSSYAFRYSHPQSSMDYIIKVGRLGGKAVVDAIALGDDKRTTFDVTVADYISDGNLPANPVERDGDITPEAHRNIQDIFISSGRLSDLGSLLKLKVIQKLAPGISKEGYEESSTSTATGTTNAQQARDPDAPNLREPQAPAYDPLRDPLRYDPPARPRPFQDPNVPRPFGELQPPGFDDELDLMRGPRGGLGAGRSPFNIGYDDLNPAGMGPYDPLQMPGRSGGGGGMHPTFDDPMFGGQGGGRRGDLTAPDGARYDPVGPADPRGGPRGFPGAGHRGPGGAPHNPFGGFGGDDFL